MKRIQLIGCVAVVAFLVLPMLAYSNLGSHNSTSLVLAVSTTSTCVCDHFQESDNDRPNDTYAATGVTGYYYLGSYGRFSDGIIYFSAGYGTSESPEPNNDIAGTAAYGSWRYSTYYQDPFGFPYNFQGPDQYSVYRQTEPVHEIPSGFTDYFAGETQCWFTNPSNPQYYWEGDAWAEVIT